MILYKTFPGRFRDPKLLARLRGAVFADGLQPPPRTSLRPQRVTHFVPTLGPQSVRMCHSLAQKKKKKEPGDYPEPSFRQLEGEGGKRSREMINIWDGMTAAEVARQSQLPLEEIYEAVDLAKINYNGCLTIGESSRILRILNKAQNHIIDPEKRGIKREIHRDIGLARGTQIARRPPVVTIMGHVDHGKTTLLDALRRSEIVKQEHGGITQHIGAFLVSLDEADHEESMPPDKPERGPPVGPPGPNSKKPKKVSIREKIEDIVTFLDTPGHAAFSAMRQRGAYATDIVVLVVAADDGVMEQTIESINYAKNAGVPIIVAINKIDKVNDLDTSVDLLKRGLHAQGIILEEDGGETQVVKISALEEIGLEDVKLAILAQAETLELQSHSDGPVQGVVIESSVLAQRGPVATLLIQSGTLRRGDIVVAGNRTYARVRSLFDEWGRVLDACSPGMPIQIIGWRDGTLPEAGDEFTQVLDEKTAKRLIADSRAREEAERAEDWMHKYNEAQREHVRAYREALVARRASGRRFGRYGYGRPRPKEIEEDPLADRRISLLLKCDVHGSMEAILAVLDSYPNDEKFSPVMLDLLSYGVGSVSEEDVEMAALFPHPIIYAFNLSGIPPAVLAAAKEKNVTIRRFNVIYHLVNDLRREIDAKLPPLDQMVVLGEAQVLQEFLITERSQRIPVAGSRCQRGLLKKKSLFKLVRAEKTIAEGMRIASMKHFKEDVASINKDQECGLRFAPPHAEEVNFRPGDRLISYEVHQVAQKTAWRPKGF